MGVAVAGTVAAWQAHSRRFCESVCCNSIGYSVISTSPRRGRWWKCVLAHALLARADTYTGRRSCNYDNYDPTSLRANRFTQYKKADRTSHCSAIVSAFLRKHVMNRTQAHSALNPRVSAPITSSRAELMRDAGGELRQLPHAAVHHALHEVVDGVNDGGDG